jgi:hypothetical protein
MTEWWPLATRSVALTDAVSCEVEPRVGGRLFERAKDGACAPWGTVLVWDEPWRFAFTWHPGLPESAATEVLVTFTEVPAGTQVELEHRRWEALDERAAELRGRYERGWPGVLARFVERADGKTTTALSETTGPGCKGP